MKVDEYMYVYYHTRAQAHDRTGRVAITEYLGLLLIIIMYNRCRRRYISKMYNVHIN